MKKEIIAKKQPTISEAIKHQLAFDELISKYHKLLHSIKQYCQTKCPLKRIVWCKECAKCPLDIAGKEE